MNDLISVIVPCYNQSEYLDETLLSVFNQTHQNWECLIINDGSTDNTEKVALKWSTLDTRFIYFYKKNGGLSSARNVGIEKCRGNYIQFLDSDDLIAPTKFEEQLKDLCGAQISVCNYFPFDDLTGEFVVQRYLSPYLNSNKYKEEIISEWEYRKSIPCHSVLFSRDIVSNNLLNFNEDLKNHEDWVFWVMLFFYADVLINNKNTLAQYRIRKGSMSDQHAMKIGFLIAADLIINFFSSANDSELRLLAVRKKQEIMSRNKKKNKLIQKIHRLMRYFKKMIS